MRTFFATALLLGSLAAGVAQASTLSSQDLLQPGDGLVTFDSRTNLQWLDVTATLGVSQYDILGGSGGWIADGFRYASFDEFKGLLSSGDMTEVGNYSSPGSTDGYFRGSAAVGQALLGLIGGATNASGAYNSTIGFIAPTPCGNDHSSLCEPLFIHGQYVSPGFFSYAVRVQWNDSVGARTIPTDGPYYANAQPFYIGSFLVRAVPEPAGYLLLLTGMLMLCYTGRRAGKSARTSHPGGWDRLIPWWRRK